MLTTAKTLAGSALLAFALFANPVIAQSTVETTISSQNEADFQRDREAILAMAGNYQVQFNFTETVAFTPGYTPKDPKISSGHEIVRIIEDRGDFISLQHILVVGGQQKMPIKHWRQDWQYQPDNVLVYIGGNAWHQRPVDDETRKGSWSQTVYQVDDAPRYGAVGHWSHANGVSEWVPPAEWRPLPRRDMTTRDDYHAILAVNRHAITPDGWVHEQDNSKLVLGEKPHILVREIGVNTYLRSDDFPTEVGDEYWQKTAEYWAGVRGIWNAMKASGKPIAVIQKGETERLYLALLGLAEEVAKQERSTDDAIAEAGRVIAVETTTDLTPLASRLREAEAKAES